MKITRIVISLLVTVLVTLPLAASKSHRDRAGGTYALIDYVNFKGFEPTGLMGNSAKNRGEYRNENPEIPTMLPQALVPATSSRTADWLK